MDRTLPVVSFLSRSKRGTCGRFRGIGKAFGQCSTPTMYELKPVRLENSLHLISCVDCPRPRCIQPDIRPPVLERFTRFFRSEEHTSELQSLTNLVCRLL